MRLRSLLFVPADSERKFARAQSSGADGLILDLEDAVAPGNKDKARSLLPGFLSATATRSWTFWVRINAFDTSHVMEDLVAAVRPGLDGIVLPKANGAEDVTRLGHYLDALEVRAGIAPGHVKILVVATETPQAMFNLGSYTPRHPRLAGLTWGAEDLSTALGANANKAPDGNWRASYQMARSLCLFAAASAGVAPIDTLYADFRDEEGLRKSCRTSREDGFVGRIAIHPDQVIAINASFTPTDDEVAEARRIVDAFEAAGNAGTVGIDGRMYDIPHLKAAHRLLSQAQGEV